MLLRGLIVLLEGKNRGLGGGRLLKVFDSESEDFVFRRKNKIVAIAFAQGGLPFPL